MDGKVRIYDASTLETLYEKKNIIVNGVSYLFAQVMSSNTSIVASVWGLAIGAGGSAPAWSPTQQPDPTAAQYALVSEIKRKQLNQAQFLDSNGNPTSTMTTTVSFQTILNGTTDAIGSSPIREMALIGGGQQGVTNMLTAPFFTPSQYGTPSLDSVIMINYFTMPSFILPSGSGGGVNIGIDWVLNFA